MKSTYFSSCSQAVNSQLDDAICNDFMKDYEAFAGRNNRSKAKTNVSNAKSKNEESDSPRQYRRAIKQLAGTLSCVSSVPRFIANFDEVIAVLYDAGEKEYAKQVAQIAYYHILSNNLQNKTHTTGTAIKVFVDYVNCRRKRPSHYCSYKCSGEVSKIKLDIDSFCKDHQFYSKSDLISKMESRLRRQDRLSGNKIWLPLGLIAKIYNPSGSKSPKNKRFINWINSIAQNIFIHYNDGGQVNASKLKDVAAIELESNPLMSNPNNMKVYVILDRGGRYEALTPTGVLNKKEYIEIDNIKDIVIDHVKPIDLTLRDLGNAGSLKNLDCVSKAMQNNKKVSDAYKQLIKSKTLTGEFENELYKELISISNDSPCRLMVSNLNSEKSNLTEYKYIRKVKTQKDYYGIVYGDVDEVCIDQKGFEYVICQHLDDKFSSRSPMVYTMADFKKLNLGSKNIKLINIDINLI